MRKAFLSVEELFQQIGGNLSDLDDHVLKQIVTDHNKRILRGAGQARDFVDVPIAGVQDGFRALEVLNVEESRRLRRGIDEASKITRRATGKVEDATWDITPLKGLSDRYQTVYKAPAQAPPRDTGISIRGYPAPVNPADIPVTEVYEPLELLKQDIQNISTNLTGAEGKSGYNVLYDLRMRADKIVQSVNHVSPDVRADAKMLSDGITDLITKGKGGNKKLRGLIQESETQYKAMNDVRSLNLTKQILAEPNPTTIVKKYFTEDRVDELATMKDMLTKSGKSDLWLAMQAEYKQNLLQNKNYVEVMQLLDPALMTESRKKFLDTILPDKTSRDAIREYATQLKSVNEGLLSQVMNKSLTSAERAIELASTGSQAQLTDLVTQIGGLDSPQGRALQMGMLTHILNHSTRVAAGESRALILDPRLFTSRIDELDRKGTLDIVFGTEAKDYLKNMARYLNVFPSAEADMGNSLARAELAEKTSSWVSPVKMLRGRQMQLSNFMQAAYYVYGEPGIPGITRGFGLKARNEAIENLLKDPLAKTRRNYPSNLVAITARTIAEMEKDGVSMFGRSTGNAQIEAPTFVVHSGTIPAANQIPQGLLGVNPH